MTKEELRKEATSTVEWESTPMVDRPLFVHGYITGAEPREKRIADLENENAELKEQNNKAKELIETMLIYQEGLSRMGELKQEAVRFLKESE